MVFKGKDNFWKRAKDFVSAEDWKHPDLACPTIQPGIGAGLNGHSSTINCRGLRMEQYAYGGRVTAMRTGLPRSRVISCAAGTCRPPSLRCGDTGASRRRTNTSTRRSEKSTRQSAPALPRASPRCSGAALALLKRRSEGVSAAPRRTAESRAYFAHIIATA